MNPRERTIACAGGTIKVRNYPERVYVSVTKDGASRVVCLTSGQARELVSALTGDGPDEGPVDEDVHEAALATKDGTP